ncbi:uronyl 2-sulfotransferase isoform X2 [Podarcis lilfordi]|uniref:Uronyl 2-sulfotransferase isoform X2 n=1 Tax=Podarcis lilfordi TaxID=74358 RepID=A0AA35P3F1_9SAUR|nr:uronyl 2-sulfotransferase isoform X2 [Podarcis lilfordi]
MKKLLLAPPPPLPLPPPPRYSAGFPEPRPHVAPPPAAGAPGQGAGWRRRRPLSLLPFLSLRDYGFCMAALLLFCLGSLFYQLNGGAPRFLLDLRHYLGNSTYLDDHGPLPRKVLPFPSQVVYNRVGKCGSRTVVLLLRILSERHGFNLVTSDIHNKTRLTKNEQMELIKNISTAEQPYLFTRHVHFLNFSRILTYAFLRTTLNVPIPGYFILFHIFVDSIQDAGSLGNGPLKEQK